MITETKIREKELQIAKKRAEDRLEQRKRESESRKLERKKLAKQQYQLRKKSDKEHAKLAPYRKENEGLLVELLASFHSGAYLEDRYGYTISRLHEILVKGKYRESDIPKKYFEEVIGYFSNTDDPEILYKGAELYDSLGDENKAYSLRYKARQNAELQARRDAIDFERVWN